MKTKFTKASQKDKTLVTVSLAQFDEVSGPYGYDRSYILLNDTVHLLIDNQEVAFVVNRVRDGKAITAVTHCFPRYLPLPRIGRPVYAETSGVI